jgi:hypothetical protein
MVSYSNGWDNTWTKWVTTSTSTTACSSNDVWYIWSGTDSATSTGSTAVWQRWVTTVGTSSGNISYEPYRTRELTPEEKEQHRLAQEKAKQEAEERQRKYDEARKKAEELLFGCLNPEQKEELKKDKHFHVLACSGKRYRVRPGTTVEELDETNKTVARYCIHTKESVPAYDEALIQKLMLELNEPEFLRIANRITVR